MGDAVPCCSGQSCPALDRTTPVRIWPGLLAPRGAGHPIPTMTVMQQNPKTGKFEKTERETIAREWVRENTRFLKYLL